MASGIPLKLALGLGCEILRFMWSFRPLKLAYTHGMQGCFCTKADAAQKFCLIVPPPSRSSGFGKEREHRLIIEDVCTGQHERFSEEMAISTGFCENGHGYKN